MSKKKAANAKKGKQSSEDDDWEAILEAEKAANASLAPAAPAAPSPAPAQKSLGSTQPPAAPEPKEVSPRSCDRIVFPLFLTNFFFRLLFRAVMMTMKVTMMTKVVMEKIKKTRKRGRRKVKKRRKKPRKPLLPRKECPHKRKRFFYTNRKSPKRKNV
jgi:hypothetical protein